MVRFHGDALTECWQSGLMHLFAKQAVERLQWFESITFRLWTVGVAGSHERSYKALKLGSTPRLST